MSSRRVSAAVASSNPVVPPAPEGLDALRSSQAFSGERSIVDHDDLTISRLLLDGDAHGAVTACARAYGALVGRLCYVLLGTQAEADEAAQETMIAAYHAAPSYRGEGTSRAWLLSIARHVCATRVEVRVRQARRRVLLTAEPTATVDASELHDDAERDARVRAALDELTAGDRELLILRFEGEQSFRDIAAVFGIDDVAARKRVGRALSRLRERMASSPPPPNHRALERRRP